MFRNLTVQQHEGKNPIINWKTISAIFFTKEFTDGKEAPKKILKISNVICHNFPVFVFHCFLLFLVF
jgi:hypothetical protein